MSSPPEVSSLSDVRETAAAKINLFLHVGGRRADGFHALQSLAVFTGLGDALRFAPAQALTLALDGPFAAGLSDESDNLILRAARALKPGGGAAIALTKILPVASGIGGGSADAAAALRGLARVWNLNPDRAALTRLAAQIGSDVPVCIASAPAWMEGRGEIVTVLDAMPRLSLLLVNPGVAVPTKAVFGALAARSGTQMDLRGIRLRDGGDVLRLLQQTTNDLEAPALAIQPVIGTVLAALRALPAALFARMSGSGATCFALFPDDKSCAHAGDALRARHPDWWIAPTRT
jgi:4-diphosphocytidyl-2-C-methyl-D-erythritol kinase